MSPPGEKEKDPPLDPSAKSALGNLSPQAAWEQVKALVDQAWDQYQDEAQRVAENYNLPVDFPNLQEWLELMNPVKGVNELHYINPELSLENLPKQDPVKVFEAVVRIMTVSDRYLSLK